MNLPVFTLNLYKIHTVVTADERSGNLYKNVFVQDSTGATNLRQLNSGGLYQGDYVRIYLKGTFMNMYNGMLQIDSVNVLIEPGLIGGINLGSTNQCGLHRHIGLLLDDVIVLENVQFSSADTSGTYADAVSQQSMNPVELSTGFNFLSNVSDSIESVIENKVDNGPTQ